MQPAVVEGSQMHFCPIWLDLPLAAPPKTCPIFFSFHLAQRHSVTTVALNRCNIINATVSPVLSVELLQYDHLELSKTKFFWLRTETSLRASQCAKSFVCLGHFDISGILDLQIKWKIFIGLFVTCDDWRKLEEMHQNRPPQNSFLHLDTSVIP